MTTEESSPTTQSRWSPFGVRSMKKGACHFGASSARVEPWAVCEPRAHMEAAAPEED
ncbi:hypothetical protein V6Z11_A10G157300 [Gossypium hirsutum]